jgi:membrane protein insertase Oxa1/YidC/SpoIIIJ
MSQQWTPPPAPSVEAPVGNNLPLAIVASVVSLIFCCLPHGVISLIFATQVNKKAEAGDTAGAMQAAKQAKMFAWISIIVSVIWFVISLIFGILGGILSAIQSH